MVEQDEIYKCEICGNVVSVIEAHEGALVCCGKEMVRQKPKGKEQEGNEKHVPMIKQTEKGVIVKVGSVPHPMEEGHYISLIQLYDKDGIVTGKRLSPKDDPEAEFCCLAKKEGLRARIYCNVHGLWLSEEGA